MPQPDSLAPDACSSSTGLRFCFLCLLAYHGGQGGISFIRLTDLHIRIRRLGKWVRIYGIPHQVHSNRRPFPGPIPRGKLSQRYLGKFRNALSSCARLLAFSAPELTRQSLVLDPMGLLRLCAKPFLPILLILLVVSFEPHDLALSLEGQNVRCDPIQEPAVV